MTTLVSGGSGFIGSHVVAQLEAAGEKVHVFDHSGLYDHNDVTDYEMVCLSVAECDAVIHLAGVLGTAELFDDPQRAIEVNIGGAVNMMRACCEHDATLVQISMPPVWDNIYQATKNAAAKFADAYVRHRGLKVATVRAFNAYGTRQAVGPGHPQKIVPTFAHRAWRNEPIPIWGDGSQSVDLVWAGDVAEMLIRARDFGDNRTFDAGTGKAMSVLEVAELVIARTGSTAGVEFLPMRAGEHASDKVVAHGEGWDLMGWHPPVRKLQLVEAIDYYAEDRT